MVPCPILPISPSIHSRIVNSELKGDMTSSLRSGKGGGGAQDPVFSILLIRLVDRQPLPDVSRSLLHGVQPEVPRHRRRVVPVPGHEPREPLALLLRLVPLVRLGGPAGLGLEQVHHPCRLGAGRALVVLTFFLLLLLVVVVSLVVGLGLDVVERVVERVVLAQHPHDLAVRVALHLDAPERGAGTAGRRHGEGVLGAAVGGRHLCRGVDAAGGLAEFCREAQAAVILGEGFFLVPVRLACQILVLGPAWRAPLPPGPARVFVDSPVLCDEAVAEGVEWLLEPVWLPDGWSR